MITQAELQEFKIRRERYDAARKTMEKFKAILDVNESDLVGRIITAKEKVELGEFTPRVNEVSRMTPAWKTVAIGLYVQYEGLSAEQAVEQVRSATEPTISQKLELISDKSPLEVEAMLTNLLDVKPAESLSFTSRMAKKSKKR